MDLIAQHIRERFGPDVAASRDTFAFRVGDPRTGVQALYDPHNRRLKIFDLRPEDVKASEELASCLAAEAANELYSKIIIYARSHIEGWQDFGLRQEAVIRGFFGNGDDAALWTKYTAPPRAYDPQASTHDKVLRIAQQKRPARPALPQGYTCAPANPADAAEIAALMSAVFPDYPTPLTAEHLTSGMAARTSHFRMVRDADGRLVACASAEIHHTRRSAELTDCATLAEERGKGLMSVILRGLERDLARDFGITDVYTIARAGEVGMNCSFAKLGYRYTGRLVNNCRMPEGWESMNVWCRNTNGEAA
jgi:beta-lysine N6-acetyltransferase